MAPLLLFLEECRRGWAQWALRSETNIFKMKAEFLCVIAENVSLSRMSLTLHIASDLNSLDACAC